MAPDKEDRLSNSSWMLIIYVLVFIAIFYFMAIRPQQKRRRAHMELLSSLKRGDRISTAAGIYGTVKKIEDNIVHVEIARGVTMKISRQAVVEILRKDTSEGQAALPEGSTRKGRGAKADAEMDETVAEDTDIEPTEGSEIDDQDTTDSEK